MNDIVKEIKEINDALGIHGAFRADRFNDRTLAEVKDEPVATKEQLKNLRSTQAKWDELTKAINATTRDAAVAAFHAQNSAQFNAADPTGGDIWTKADFVEDYKIRRHAFHEERKRVCMEAVETCKAILGRVQESARELAEGMAEHERDQAELYGLPFEPSNVLLAVADVARRIMKRADALGQTSPRAMLAGIVDL